MSAYEVCGWIGSISFAFCGAPQAYKSWKEGHSRGLSAGLITMWLIGVTFSIIYAVHINKLPLLLNFLSNLVFMLVMTRYKLFPRKKSA